MQSTDDARLSATYLKTKAALYGYLGDAEESGCEEYTLAELVPIPLERPDDLDLDSPEGRAWGVRSCVIAVKRELGRQGHCAQLSGEGRLLWKKFLAYSREQERAADIYSAGCDFRDWVEAKIARPQERDAEKEVGKNEFRKVGEFWSLTYEGETTCVGDSVGMFYISRLLREPSRDIPAVLLLAARGDIDSRVVSGSSGEVLTAETIEQYRKRLTEIEEELEEAKVNNDEGRTDELRREKEFLEKEISRAFGLNKRSREDTDTEKVRKAVSEAVRRAIETIGEHHEALGRHLDAFISSGATFKYDPEREIDWVI